MSEGPPTARELQQRTLAAEGNRGIVCPKCGASHLIANNKQVLPTGTINRYRYCRNPKCGARFLFSQPPERMIREVKPNNPDEDEPPILKVRSA